MEEPQKPKKSWISYWIIALCVFLLLQAFVFPNLFKGRVKEVGYETFISMTENNEIGSVTIESNQITFTDKSEKQVYQTGRLDDPDLIQRLYNSGAKFESQRHQSAAVHFNQLCFAHCADAAGVPLL